MYVHTYILTCSLVWVLSDHNVEHQIAMCLPVCMMSWLRMTHLQLETQHRLLLKCKEK